MQQGQQQPADEDPIRTAVLNKKLSLWERFLRWVYSKQEWDAYLLEKIEKARAKEAKRKQKEEGRELNNNRQ